MKPQKLRVNDVNRVVPVRGKPIRTPFETIVRTEKELDFFKMVFRSQGIHDWSLRDIEPEDTPKKSKEEKPKPKKQEPKPEPKNVEDMSILEKIMEDKLEDVDQ